MFIFGTSDDPTWQLLLKIIGAIENVGAHLEKSSSLRLITSE